jgi:hypothetical protein
MMTENGAMSSPKSNALSLDDRIVAAFADDTKSDKVASLIEEVEAAATAAGEEAKQARERALDPTLSDVAAARREADDAAFRRDRLQVAATRLRERLSELRAIEENARRRIRWEQVKAERDRLAAELTDTYPAIERQLVDLFARLDANDREVKYLNAHLPTGAARPLNMSNSVRLRDANVHNSIGGFQTSIRRYVS